MRAELPHTVLTLDVWRRSARWDKDVGGESQEACVLVDLLTFPTSSDCADCVAEAAEATCATPRCGKLPVATSCQESHGIGNTHASQTGATGRVPAQYQLRFNFLQLSCHTLANGLSLDHEPACRGTSPTDVSET